MPETVTWTSRPIFITSTFRDMHAERDHLRTHVFPVLEERLRERFHHLETIDLRWGVESVSEADQAEREVLILKVCLNEIERSRPFLLGILGDRYGWVPPADRMAAAAREAGFDTDLARKSVTELEILYGVLDSPDQRSRSWFYFRDPLPYDDMAPETAAWYSDAHSSDPAVRDYATKLESLKDRIRRALPGRVRAYCARWDAAANRVTGLDEWGRQVLDDLWSDLQRETEQFLREAPKTWQAQELRSLDEFAENRARGFVGREAVTRDLMAIVNAPAQKDTAQDLPWGVCVTGSAGLGKSALFSHAYRTLRARGDVLVLAHAAGTTIRSTQVDAMLRRWVYELAGDLGLTDPLEDNSSADDVQEAFSQFLGRASTQQRVVILIDALNEFEPTTRAKHLTWLPKIWTPNARLIATAIPCDASEALLQRPGVTERSLTLLSMAEAGEIARSICARHHRSLPDDALDVLLSKPASQDQPAAGNPLWVELAVEELDLLDADAFARAERDFADIADPEQRLRALLADTAERMPGDVPALYNWMLDRAEKVFGRDWTRSLVNLLAVSRAGWRDSDLGVLMPRLSVEQWDGLRYAAVRRSFRAHVVQRGAQGQWDFFHTQMRLAIEARMRDQGTDPATIHAAVAAYLREELPREDPLHETETMHHLVGADDRLGAGRYYGSDLTAGEETGATAILAALVLTEDDAAADGLAWLTALPSQADLSDAQVGAVCSRLNFGVDDAIMNVVTTDTRLSVLQSAKAPLERLASQSPTNVDWQRDLSVSHIKVGDVLLAQGDAAGALAAYRASLTIHERLASQDPTAVDWQRDLSVSHSRAGDVLLAQGDAAGALAEYRAGLVIRERLASEDPKDAGWQRDLSVNHEKVGNVLLAQGDATGALAAYRAGLVIHERLTSQDPTNTDWQRGLSVSHIKVGDVLLAQGDAAGALAAYRASLAIHERLTSQDPTNAGWQRDLSVSHEKVGNVLRAQGDMRGALAEYGEGQAIHERLASQDPTNAGWQWDLSVSHNRVGTVLQVQGDAAGALAAYGMGQVIAERLVSQDPTNAGWQRNLSVSHIKVGGVLQAQGDAAGALAAYRAGLVIHERLASQDPTNADWQRDLTVSHIKVGDVLRTQGDAAGALTEYRASLVIHERLASQDPTNAGRQRDLSVGHEKVGDVLLAEDDTAGAVAAYRASRVIRERLASQDPTNADWQRDLSLSNNKIGNVLLARGDAAGALAAYRASLVIRERLASQDPTNVGRQRDLSVNHEKVGNALQAQGDGTGALAQYRASLAIRERLASQDPTNAGWQRDLVVSHHKLAMMPGQADAEAERHLGQCLAVLRGMVSSGMHLDPPLRGLLDDLEDDSYGHV